MTTTTRATAPLLLLSLLGVTAAGCSASSAPGAPATGGEDAAASPSSPSGQDSSAPVVSPPSSDAAASAGDAGSTGAPTDAASDAPSTSIPGWTLVWNDEFNLADGSAADSTKWTQETGNGGWSTNQEREYYTAGTANAVVQGGALVITATNKGASALTCQYGPCQYTSARLNTSGKFKQMYGRFEARIKIPRGQGMWPAWWMLGDNIGSAGWPQCGEVDIMENIGKTPSTDYGSLHGPGYSGGQDLTGSYSLPDGGALADDFHVYAVEWEQSAIRFYFDGVNYETRTPADVPAGKTWVYDHPFFLILNLAVGGQWPGDPNATTVLPQTMAVDYVRVYSKAP